MEDKERGQRASNLMQDPLIVDAMKCVHEALHAEWELTQDPKVRDEIWFTLQGANRFTRYFDIAISNGQIALQRELKNGRAN